MVTKYNLIHRLSQVKFHHFSIIYVVFLCFFRDIRHFYVNVF